MICWVSTHFDYAQPSAIQAAAQLGDYQVAPAVWQSYLQRQDRAAEASQNKLAQSI